LITTTIPLYGEIPMEINQVTPLAPPLERRQFGRINISEPRICHVHMPQSQELWTGQGILVNISLGGIYFVCDRQPPIEKEDICYLTFDTPYSDSENSHFGFHVSVVRTEKTQIYHPQFAVALRIISEPIYYSLHGNNKREFTSLDKPRLMYQYYELNKKAYEIITNTPEIRTEKIKNIRKFIEEGSYQVKPERVTQSVFNNLLVENILRQKS
jgi:anti-sigma28 factor (negative regulator of flagellin synthesis)